MRVPHSSVSKIPLGLISFIPLTVPPRSLVYALVTVQVAVMPSLSSPKSLAKNKEHVPKNDE